MICRRVITGLAGILALTSAASAQDPSQIWNYWGSGAEHDAIQSVIDLSNKMHPDTPVARRLPERDGI
jgi:ABC-type glycerol-3-phosphate transport system substrate-binding protein